MALKFRELNFEQSSSHQLSLEKADEIELFLDTTFTNFVGHSLKAATAAHYGTTAFGARFLDFVPLLVDNVLRSGYLA